MNVAANILLLSIVTLVASRHIHAYRISRRRRPGGRTTFRQTTTSNSDSTSMPHCDPTTCCDLNACLRYALYPEILCPPQTTTEEDEELRYKRGSMLLESTWPFFRQNSETDFGLPSSSPSSQSTHFHRDYSFSSLTPEEKFIARKYYGRFFRKREDLPPIPNDVTFEDSRSIFSKRTGEGATTRIRSAVCPRTNQWEIVRIAVNFNGQLVQMVQDGDFQQWVLDESCESEQSPVYGDVICENEARYVPAVVVVPEPPAGRKIQEERIRVNCCRAFRIE